jgi:hypothetical protein
MTVVGGTAEPRVLLLTEAAILSDSAICRERLWALRRRFLGTRDLFSAREVRRMEFVKQAIASYHEFEVASALDLERLRQEEASARAQVARRLGRQDGRDDRRAGHITPGDEAVLADGAARIVDRTWPCLAPQSRTSAIAAYVAGYTEGASDG